MQCVDWRLAREKEREPLRTPTEDDYVWADPLTKTHYCLSRSDAQRLMRDAWTILRDQSAEQVYQQLSSEPESALLPLAELPASPVPWRPNLQSLPTTARLVDRAILRTGLLAALIDATQRTDWPALRRTCLLWGLETWPQTPDAPPDGLPPEIGALLLATDRAAQGQACTFPAEYQVDLVKGGAVKVKQYLLETTNIKAVRGASMLLDDINLERIPALFRTAPYTPEMLVYAGGGHFLAVVPSGQGQALAAQVEQLYERVTLSAQCAVTHLPCAAADFADIKRALDDVEVALHERQMSRLPAPIGGYPYADINLMIQGQPYPPWSGSAPQGDRCTYCGVRPPRWDANMPGEKLLLCEPCSHKYRAGTTGRARLYEEYKRYASLPAEAAPPQTLEELAAGGMMAVFYGDGNNMGQVVAGLKSLAEYRYFSQRTERAIFEATFGALRQAHEQRVEFVALGGDDLLFIAPAQGALEIATALGRCFDETFANPTATAAANRRSITISIGVVIAPYHTPVRQLFDLLQRDLLKEAKRRARALGSAAPSGTVQIVALTSSQALNPTYGDGTPSSSAAAPKLTIRPFTWEEASAFTALGRAVAAPSSTWSRAALYGLREALTAMGPEEANLFYDYQMKRRDKDDKELEDALTCLASALGATADSAFFCKGEERVTPWIDLVELLDYLSKERGAVDAAEAQGAPSSRLGAPVTRTY